MLGRVATGMLICAASVVLCSTSVKAETRSFVLQTDFEHWYAPAQLHLGGSHPLPAFRLMDRQSLKLRKKTWWVEGLKEIELDVTDSIMGINVGFSARERRGHLDFKTSALDELGLKIHTHVRFLKGKAAIKARLRVAQNYTIELPEIIVVPKTLEGQRYVEYQLPILSGTF